MKNKSTKRTHKLGLIRLCLIVIGLATFFPAVTSFSQTVSFDPATNFDVGIGPVSVAIGDLNGDGFSDIATVNTFSFNVSILLGDGDGTFSPATNFSVGTDPISVAIGDFNNNGRLDIAVANQSSNNVSILLNTGSTSLFDPPTNYPVGRAPISVAIGDFNGDGNLDVAVGNIASSNISILLGDGDGTFSPATNFAVLNPRSLAIGDFNGDLILDIAVANVFGNSLSILLGLGNGNFSTATNFSVGTSPASVAIGDFNGDGEFDVVMGHLFSNNVSILLGFGNGTFSVATNLVVGSRPQSVAIGDFNGDGNLDVAVGDIANRNISIILGAGDGTFSAATNFTVGLQPSSIAIGDFNVDSKLDLAVTNVSSHNVSILLNTTVTNEPPNCTDAFPSISQIWPPNHKMIDIQINGVTDPDGDPVTITITKITQDEPLNTFGDGNFDPDGSGIGTSVAQVRAERTGTKKVPGNGRVYRIWYTASDGKGGECKSSVVVCVPHDKGKSSVCIDDGQRYNSVTGELEIIPSGIAVELNDKLGIDRGEALPASFNLSNAYPNPFNPSTVIKYALPEASFVTLKIYNMLGQEIKTLVNSDKNAGTYTVQWNGDNNFGIKVASGTYIYRIVTGNYVQSNKMILLK